MKMISTEHVAEYRVLNLPTCYSLTWHVHDKQSRRHVFNERVVHRTDIGMEKSGGAAKWGGHVCGKRRE